MCVELLGKLQRMWTKMQQRTSDDILKESKEKRKNMLASDLTVNKEFSWGR